MQLVNSYTVVVADAMAECRDFYATWFDFEVAFEASWFVLLTHRGERPLSLAFMRPDHPSSPPSPGTHRGDGSFLTLQVQDATAEYNRLVEAGMHFALALTDEPWGPAPVRSWTPPDWDRHRRADHAGGTAWWGPVRDLKRAVRRARRTLARPEPYDAGSRSYSRRAQT